MALSLPIGEVHGCYIATPEKTLEVGWRSVQFHVKAILNALGFSRMTSVDFPWGTMSSVLRAPKQMNSRCVSWRNILFWQAPSKPRSLCSALQLRYSLLVARGEQSL